MVSKYKQFNERKSNRSRGSRPSNIEGRAPMKKYNRGEYNYGISPNPSQRGMPLDFSPRFKYIITKISNKNNKIAIDLLDSLNKPNARFEYSYLDLTNRGDTLSYLPNGERNTPEDQKYITNKRQHSKVYKVIKTIFGSKYTKTEVNKFVSMFKQTYDEGPPKKPEIKSRKTTGQLLKNIIDDTIDGKLQWSKLSDIKDVDRYKAKIKITEKKYLDFVLYLTKNESNSFLTINFFNDNKDGEWISTFTYKDLINFIQTFKNKYNIE